MVVIIFYLVLYLRMKLTIEAHSIIIADRKRKINSSDFLIPSSCPQTQFILKLYFIRLHKDNFLTIKKHPKTFNITLILAVNNIYSLIFFPSHLIVLTNIHYFCKLLFVTAGKWGYFYLGKDYFVEEA